MKISKKLRKKYFIKSLLIKAEKLLYQNDTFEPFINYLSKIKHIVKVAPFIYGGFLFTPLYYDDNLPPELKTVFKQNPTKLQPLLYFHQSDIVI